MGPECSRRPAATLILPEQILWMQSPRAISMATRRKTSFQSSKAPGFLFCAATAWVVLAVPKSLAQLRALPVWLWATSMAMGSRTSRCPTFFRTSFLSSCAVARRLHLHLHLRQHLQLLPHPHLHLHPQLLQRRPQRQHTISSLHPRQPQVLFHPAIKDRNSTRL